jgi:hypothetical protein
MDKYSKSIIKLTTDIYIEEAKKELPKPIIREKNTKPEKQLPKIRTHIAKK